MKKRLRLDWTFADGSTVEIEVTRGEKNKPKLLRKSPWNPSKTKH